MADKYPPVFKANKINAYINSVLWYPMPIHWNDLKHKWELLKSRRLIYYTSIVTAECAMILLHIWALLIGLKNSEICTTTQIFALILQIFLVGLMLVSNLVAFFDDDEVVIGTNWCYQREMWIQEYGNPKFAKKCAILGYGSVFLCVIEGLTVALGAAYADLDAFYIPFKYYRPDLTDKWYLKLFRYIFIVYLSQAFLLTFRTLSLPGFSSLIYRNEYIRLLKTRRPTSACIMLYKEISIVQKVTFDIDYKTTTAALSAVFILLVVLVHILLIAVERKLVALILMCGFVIVIDLLFINFLLIVGCSFFKLSSCVLRSWRNSVNGAYFRKNGEYFKKVVKSLRILSLPAGEAGIVDTDMKMNYMEKSLGYIVDSIVTKYNLR